VNILGKFSIKTGVIALAAAAILSGCAGPDTTSAQAPPAAVTEATSFPSPSSTSPSTTTPTETTDPEIAPTDPPDPAVTEFADNLVPELGQDDSLTHTSTGKTSCSDNYTPKKLTLNGTVDVDGTPVTTTVKKTTVVIETHDKLMTAYSLVVNGTKGTPLNPDVAQATHSTLTLKISNWTPFSIKSMAFCLGAGGDRAPILPD
jgi:hypothetical protein